MKIMKIISQPVCAPTQPFHQDPSIDPREIQEIWPKIGIFACLSSVSPALSVYWSNEVSVILGQSSE